METKQEFIDGLRRALTGKISQSEVEEHIRYYEDYITAESRKEGGERAVLERLGNPSLIAVSICAADEAEERVKGAENVYTASEGHYNDNKTHSGYEDVERDGRNGKSFFLRHPKLTVGLIVIGILLLIIFFVALAFSLLKLLWPVIVAVVMVLLLVRLIVFIRDNM